MPARQTARKAVSLRDEGETALLRFRSYRPHEDAHVERTLTTYHRLWSLARDHGVTDLEAIQRLVEVLPEEWQMWATTLADDYIWRDPETHEERADYPRFYHHLHEHYDSYGEVMPASPPPPPVQTNIAAPTTLPAPETGPSQWCQGEGSRPPHPGVVRDFPSPRYDPAGRGKGPAPPTFSSGYEADSETEPWRFISAMSQQALEETIPRILRPMIGELRDQMTQTVEEVHARLDHMIEDLGPLVHPAHEAPIPPHVLNWLPGGVHAPIVLSSDHGDDSSSDANSEDFEGSSGLSSVDGDEEVRIV